MMGMFTSVYISAERLFVFRILLGFYVLGLNLPGGLSLAHAINLSF